MADSGQLTSSITSVCALHRMMKAGASEAPEESYSTPRAYKPAGQPPPQKKLHREAKRKIEDKPDERLKSARRALSAIFTSMPCPPTPDPPKRLVHSTASTSEADAQCQEKSVSCGSTNKSLERPSPTSLTTMVQSCISAASMRTRKAVSDSRMQPRKAQSCPCKPHPLQSRGLGVAPNA
ncbi:g10878 [Coccomyxa viridis]|uniref:G10878 protein n=1 Tax=Coccomyxa viridis TaxID=1274662 RepID=A0ABP1GAQ4_9CHLO